MISRLAMPRIRNRLLRRRLRQHTLTHAAQANLHALDHLNAAMPAGRFGYTVLDLETTGLDAKKSRIVSIGAFKIRDKRIDLGRMFNQLVNPGSQFSPASIAIHGIVPGMVAAAPSASEVLNAFLQYLGNDIVVAHNARFDLTFLNRLMLAQHGFPLQNLVVDTLPLCGRLLFPKMVQALPRNAKLLGRGAVQPLIGRRGQNLEEIAHYLGIRIYQRHSATGDALATAMIFQRILAKLEDSGRGRLNDLIGLGRQRF